MEEATIDVSTEQKVFTTYEETLVNYRKKFADVVSPLLAENNQKTLLLFWIFFSSNGVGMTEPVEDWIRRAGKNCEKLGYKELGIQLGKHAIHEADHQLMMIEDTKKFIERWNKQYTPKLTAQDFFNKPMTEAVNNYRILHEHFIEGSNPYCQIAIEYEIENLSITYGPEIIEHTYKILGQDIQECLSFSVDHVKIDAAHTKFNRKVISDFLSAYPEVLQDLMDAGVRALRAYGNFLTSCLQQARAF